MNVPSISNSKGHEELAAGIHEGCRQLGLLYLRTRGATLLSARERLPSTTSQALSSYNSKLCSNLVVSIL